MALQLDQIKKQYENGLHLKWWVYLLPDVSRKTFLRRSVGKLYLTEKGQLNKLLYHEPEIVVREHQDGVGWRNVLIPVGSPVLYLGPWHKYRASVLWGERLISIHRSDLTENPISS